MDYRDKLTPADWYIFTPPRWYIFSPPLTDDLVGFGVTVADPSAKSLDLQTTVEAFYRFDLSDNIAITGDVQYLQNPGFNDKDPWVFGIRARFNL